MELKIHPELAAFLPDCSEEDDRALEQDIIASGGARDPIIVWSGQGFIIDGHRRYHFCKKHGLRFKTEDMIFDSLSEAMSFMENWQFMRRNMTPAQRALATQKMVQRRSMEASEEATKNDIVESVAKVTQRSARQVYRDLQVAEAIDSAPQEIKEVANELNAVDIAKIQKIAPEKQSEIAAVASKEDRKKELQKAIEQTSKTPAPKPKEVEDALESLAVLQRQARDLAKGFGIYQEFQSLRPRFTEIYDWLNKLKGK